MGEKILVTGATGRVGSRFVRELVSDGHEIRAFILPDDPQSNRLDGLGIERVYGSLSDYGEVADLLKWEPASIFHLAARFGPGVTPLQYFDANVQGTFNLLEAITEGDHSPRCLVIISSDGVYNKYPAGGMKEPISEKTPVDPREHNGLSKCFCEYYSSYYRKVHSLPIAVIRFPYIMSDSELLDFPAFWSDHWRGLLPVNEELNTPSPALVLPRDQEGRAYRKGFGHVDDIVGFLMQLPRLGDRIIEKIVGETFQLAGPDAMDWETAVPYLSEKMHLPYIEVETSRTYCRYEFDASQAESVFEYKPVVDSRRMIDLALEARAEHQS